MDSKDTENNKENIIIKCNRCKNVIYLQDIGMDKIFCGSCGNIINTKDLVKERVFKRDYFIRTVRIEKKNNFAYIARMIIKENFSKLSNVSAFIIYCIFSLFIGGTALFFLWGIAYVIYNEILEFSDNFISIVYWFLVGITIFLLGIFLFYGTIYFFISFYNSFLCVVAQKIWYIKKLNSDVISSKDLELFPDDLKKKNFKILGIPIIRYNEIENIELGAKVFSFFTEVIFNLILRFLSRIYFFYSFQYILKYPHFLTFIFSLLYVILVIIIIFLSLILIESFPISFTITCLIFFLSLSYLRVIRNLIIALLMYNFQDNSFLNSLPVFFDLKNVSNYYSVSNHYSLEDINKKKLLLISLEQIISKNKLKIFFNILSVFFIYIFLVVVIPLLVLVLTLNIGCIITSALFSSVAVIISYYLIFILSDIYQLSYLVKLIDDFFATTKLD